MSQKNRISKGGVKQAKATLAIRAKAPGTNVELCRFI
jgi:hypothetical protein